eukprot:TRINITY_DN12463_c1_g1_i6.p1 TRINITY_DN12463_c1_g1~~TRINITY_DN12463_c1_g1_i6.p1  ORF type:complete len:882 (+),score=106.22 TRINITY_DN12463_c1_g1_i6:60-2705(+)
MTQPICTSAKTIRGLDEALGYVKSTRHRFDKLNLAVHLSKDSFDSEATNDRKLLVLFLAELHGLQCEFVPDSLNHYIDKLLADLNATFVARPQKDPSVPRLGGIGSRIRYKRLDGSKDTTELSNVFEHLLNAINCAIDTEGVLRVKSITLYNSFLLVANFFAVRDAQSPPSLIKVVTRAARVVFSREPAASADAYDRLGLLNPDSIPPKEDVYPGQPHASIRWILASTSTAWDHVVMNQWTEGTELQVMWHPRIVFMEPAGPDIDNEGLINDAPTWVGTFANSVSELLTETSQTVLGKNRVCADDPGTRFYQAPFYAIPKKKLTNELFEECCFMEAVIRLADRATKLIQCMELHNCDEKHYTSAFEACRKPFEFDPSAPNNLDEKSSNACPSFQKFTHRNTNLSALKEGFLPKEPAYRRYVDRFARPFRAVSSDVPRLATPSDNRSVTALRLYQTDVKSFDCPTPDKPDGIRKALTSYHELAINMRLATFRSSLPDKPHFLVADRGALIGPTPPDAADPASSEMVAYLEMPLGDSVLAKYPDAFGDFSEATRRSSDQSVVVIRMLDCLISAIKELAELGLLHNDIHPGNIIEVAGRMKLIDFGQTLAMNELCFYSPTSPDGIDELVLNLVGNSDFSIRDLSGDEVVQSRVFQDIAAIGLMLLHYYLFGRINMHRTAIAAFVHESIVSDSTTGEIAVQSVLTQYLSPKHVDVVHAFLNWDRNAVKISDEEVERMTRWIQDAEKIERQQAHLLESDLLTDLDGTNDYEASIPFSFSDLHGLGDRSAAQTSAVQHSVAHSVIEEQASSPGTTLYAARTTPFASRVDISNTAAVEPENCINMSMMHGPRVKPAPFLEEAAEPSRTCNKLAVFLDVDAGEDSASRQ